MDELGLRINGNNRLVFLGALCTSDQLKHPFFQADAGIDVHTPLVKVHAQTRQPRHLGVSILLDWQGGR